MFIVDNDQTKVAVTLSWSKGSAMAQPRGYLRDKAIV